MLNSKHILMIKESQAYLIYLRKNLLILFLPIVLFSLVGFYIQITKPTVYILSRLLEANIFEDDVQKKVLLIDQAVSTTRQPHVLNGLSKDSSVELQLYKSAPLTITVSAISPEPLVLKTGVDNLSSYLEDKYKLKVVGQDITSVSKSNPLYGILFGATLGAICGLLISLIKTYFQTY